MRWQDELTQWSITQNRTEGVTKPHPGISKMMTVFAINGLNELELAKLAGHFGEMSLSDFSTIFSGYSLDELDFDQCLAIVAREIAVLDIAVAAKAFHRFANQRSGGLANPVFDHRGHQPCIGSL